MSKTDEKSFVCTYVRRSINQKQSRVACKIYTHDLVLLTPQQRRGGGSDGGAASLLAFAFDVWHSILIKWAILRRSAAANPSRVRPGGKISNLVGKKSPIWRNNWFLLIRVINVIFKVAKHLQIGFPKTFSDKLFWSQYAPTGLKFW